MQTEDEPTGTEPATTGRPPMRALRRHASDAIDSAKDLFPAATRIVMEEPLMGSPSHALMIAVELPDMRPEHVAAIMAYGILWAKRPAAAQEFIKVGFPVPGLERQTGRAA